MDSGAGLVFSRLWRCTSAALCALALIGCAVGPDFVRPAGEADESALAPRQDYGASTPSTSQSAVPAQWWSLFDDPLLADLESRAQAQSLDLKLAFERIEQSRAQLGIAASDLLPDLSAEASYRRGALSEHGEFAAVGAPSTPTNFWHFGFDADWEIDLWGRARRAREGAAASLEATVYDREAVRVALSAEVARTYLQLRGTQAQLDIARQNREIAGRTLGLAESRRRHGVATRFETSSARAQLAAIEALIPALMRRRNAMMNALALLLGEKPRALDEQLRTAMPLPAMPTRVPVGLSSELAHRRPDILRAEARLHAATAAIGVAKADFYPRIGLRGRVGLEAFERHDLDNWDSRYFAFGPTVYLPIFQGGRLTQRLALTEARQKEAALAYRQTVLRAWHEVDDALDAWVAEQRRYGELSIAYEQSRQALHAAERGYQEGAADYLSVLTAQRDVLASQTSLNDSATQATLTVVNLYKSLGGGWDPDALETASDTGVGDAGGPSPQGAGAVAAPDTSTAQAGS